MVCIVDVIPSFPALTDVRPTSHKASADLLLLGRVSCKSPNENVCMYAVGWLRIYTKASRACTRFRFRYKLHGCISYRSPHRRAIRIHHPTPTLRLPLPLPLGLILRLAIDTSSILHRHTLHRHSFEPLRSKHHVRTKVTCTMSAGCQYRLTQCDVAQLGAVAQKKYSLLWKSGNHKPGSKL